MKIRSILFNDFRSFRGETLISFCGDPAEPPRPITVLAGNNGSGKTTVLQAIEALLFYAINPAQPSHLVREAWETGLVVLEVAFGPKELNGSNRPEGTVYHIAVGRTDLRPKGFESRWPNLICRFVSRGNSGNHFVRQAPAESLKKTVAAMLRGDSPMSGGLLSFPSTRRLTPAPGGPIEPPPQVRRWLDVVEDRHAWAGSLEQQWVWENYLDLEQSLDRGQREKRQRFTPYVENIQRMLGEAIFIHEGRVWVSQGHPSFPGRVVPIDALPSGEKQVLLLLGELARRRRCSMVCLIDEPEISLHPALQHALVYHFRSFARAENAQFILATHSLEIVSALPGATVFLNKLQHGISHDSSSLEPAEAA